MDDVGALVEALKRKDAAALATLLRRDPALARARTPDGTSALRLATYLRFSQGIEALRAAGAELDLGDAAALGDTARVRALAARDRALLDAPGADGTLPLHLAAHFGRVETLTVLLNLGASIDAYQAGIFHNTALHAAAAGGQASAVEVLLAAGARPDLPDKNGFRPLHVAAASGSVPLVRMLLARGVDRHAKSHDGRTALDVAREREMDEVVALLSG